MKRPFLVMPFLVMPFYWLSNLSDITSFVSFTEIDNVSQAKHALLFSTARMVIFLARTHFSGSSERLKKKLPVLKFKYLGV